MGHSLHVRELDAARRASRVLTDEDATVCAVVAPRAVVERRRPRRGSAAEPELIRKPKEEEEAK
jgi:hypothetical protein